jgi:hypothetical protein
MKENYDLWIRVVSELESAVDKSETELLVNRQFLIAAKAKLAKFPKPKAVPADSTKAIVG